MTTEPTGPTPQDAPAGQPWPHSEWQPPPAASAPAPQRRVIPAPTGPNWVLATLGILLMITAGVAIASLLGYRPEGTIQFGPQALVGVGAVLVLVGVIGSLVRGRSCGSTHRRRAATGRGSDATPR